MKRSNKVTLSYLTRMPHLSHRYPKRNAHEASTVYIRYNLDRSFSMQMSLMKETEKKSRAKSQREIVIILSSKEGIGRA